MTRKLWLASITIAVAACSGQAALAHSVHGDEQSIELGTHVEVLEDPKRRWTIEDVASPQIGAHFAPSVEATPNFGLTDSAWWLRFRLENRTTEEQHWVLESWWAVVDLIELYDPAEEGPLAVRRAGESIPRSEWELGHRVPSFSISLPPGVSRTFYVRTLGDDTMLVPLQLLSPSAWASKRAEENLVIGLYFGIFLILAVYNLLLFASLRDVTYLYYSLWVAFVAGHQFALLGLFSQYLIPEHPAIALRSLHVFGAALVLTLVQFTRSYLSTREALPRADVWLRIMLGAYSALLLLAIFGSPAWFVRIMSPLAIAGAGFLVAAGGLAWRGGAVHAVYYLAGFALFLLSAIMMGGRAVGLLPSNFLTDHALQVSFVFTLLSLSLGLSDRMKRWTEEAESERRRAGELDRLRTQAEHSSLAKSRVLAAASHDVRQPLHAIGLFAHQLRSYVRRTRGQEILQKIEDSLDALGTMLSRLFDMSRIESGNIQPEVDDFELAVLLDRVMAEFSETAGQKGLQLVSEPGEFRVRSDVTLLGRIIQNLVANAVQHTASGEVRVCAERVGESIRIDVMDSGPGIPPEQRDAVFEEFVRLGGSERGEGLGLGLSIVQGLAGVLGHEVGVASSPLGGARFYVTVPAAEREVSTPDREPGGLAGSSLEGRLVAVVDDDLSVLEGMRSLIGEWGCEVVVACDVEDLLDGLEKRARRPDLLLADYRLQDGATGIEAIGRVRDRWGEEVPALVVTGETGPEVLAELNTRGLAYVTKPFPPHRLRAFLLEAMRPAA